MSTSPNKENYPDTPTTSDINAECSPTHKRSLKPISPNKVTNHSVGRLKFLDNDNIDEHFAYIHSSNEHIQQQLYELEIQTKQTGIDLGQLFDRSKNNNQFLSTLLENLSKYSKEVITEGNATKNDITKIVDQLNSNNNKIQQLSSDDYLEKLTAMIVESERMSISRLLDERDSRLKSQLEDIIKSEVKDIATEDKLKKVVDQIIDSFKSQHVTSKSLLYEKELKDNNQELQKSTIDKLNQILYDISQNKNHCNNIDKHLENQSNSTNQNMEVINKVHGESQDIKAYVAWGNDQIREIQAIMETNSINVNEIKNIIALNQNTDELETKISRLEKKYELLYQKYENKYEELKSLQNEFQTVLHKSKETQSTLNNINYIPNIKKVHKLHSENMNKISNKNFYESKPLGKRIVSAPIDLGLVEEEIVSRNPVSNSDDEGF